MTDDRGTVLKCGLMLFLFSYFEGKWNLGAGFQLKRLFNKERAWEWCDVSRFSKYYFWMPDTTRWPDSAFSVDSGKSSPLDVVLSSAKGSPTPPTSPIIYCRLNSPSWCCGIWFSCPGGANTPRSPHNRWPPEDVPFYISSAEHGIYLILCFIYGS